MKLVLDDNQLHLAFAPLTLTRPVGDLRMGILTNAERWKYRSSDVEVFFQTEDYLSDKFESTTSADVTVNAGIIPNDDVYHAVIHLEENEILIDNNKQWIAKRGDGSKVVTYSGDEFLTISNRWDLYLKNAQAIELDFALITDGRVSQMLSSTNTIIGDPSRIFLEKGAKVEAAILNSNDGPIYVGENAEIMEGSIVRGGLGMCSNSALKLGSKVYGPTTLGPHCKVGGEVNNVVFQAFSNKGHDGFLGNALIGEWCNLGADTNSSNLKNNYGKVSTYSYQSKQEEKTEVQFMGLCMGDHSKCGINTMFNTATVVGVSSNIYGGDFPSKYIPSFRWGGTELVPFRFDKAIEYANNMMSRRGMELSTAEIAMLKHIADNE